MGKLLLTPANATYTKPLSNVLFRNFNGSLAGFPDATMVFNAGRFSEITNCVFYNWIGSVQGSSNAGGGDFTRTRNTYYNEFNGGLYAYGNLSGLLSTEDDLVVLRGSLTGMVALNWVLGSLVNPLISGVVGVATTPGNAAFTANVPSAAGRASIEGGAIWSCLNVITQGQGASGIAPITLSNTRLGIGPTGANYTAQNAALVDASGTAPIVLDTCPLYSTSEVARRLGTGGEFMFLNKDEDPGVQEVYNSTSYSVPIISRVTDTISNSTSAVMMQWTGTAGAQYVRDFSVVIGANSTETVLIKVRKNTSYGSSTLPKAVVYDGTTAVSTETMSNTADTWETLTVEITNSNSSDKQYRIRLAGQSAVNGAKCWFAGVPLAPFITKVRWYGYDFIEASVTRRVDVYVVASEATALAYTGVTLNNTTKAITFSAGTADTMQKFYDYSRAWCVADVSRDVLFVRAGTLFQLDADWKVSDPYYTDTLTWGGGTVEFTATGAKTVSLSDTTVQMSATGDYDLSGSSLTGPIAFTTDTGVRVVTVTVPAGFTDYTTEGANITVSTPSLERGLEFTGLVAGSFVKVFTTTTTTEQFSTLSSGTAETWDDATSGSLTVDYVIMKAGYLPIRVTGVTVTGAVGTGVQTVPITQTIDRSYVASSGLTWAEIALDTTSKYVKLNDLSTVQNLYSFMIEQWIDRGGVGATGAELANVKFPVTSNGPGGFSLIDGWETRGFTVAGTGIANTTLTNLTRDGLRYVDTGGTQTSVWSAILTSGVPSGARVRYQQSDAGTTVDALVSSGNMDELVHVYGDASHGNFDKRGYLVLKVQEMGYDQAEANVVSLYGNLEDQLYVVGLSPTPNGVATGDPSLATAPTITQGTYTLDGQTYSVKIVDGATPNTGTNIMRWLRYNFETGGAFQSEDAFNWHDLVKTNGSAFKTVRGTVYGTATTKGVVVYQNDGTTLHPDFTLFTADNGATYAPPILTYVNATVLANTGVLLYNVTQDLEVDYQFVAGTSYSYEITTEANDGDVLDLFYFKEGYEEGRTRFSWGVATTTVATEQTVDANITSLRTELGITDYTTITEFTLDVTGTVEIDADDIDGDSQKARFAIWYNGVLTTENGARYLRGALSILSTAAFRINVSVLDLQFENVSVTKGLNFTDTDRRLYRSDGTPIYVPTSAPGSIQNDYSGVPDTVVTSDQAVNLATVQAGLTAQGYTTTRAPKLDDVVSEDGIDDLFKQNS